MPSPRPYIPYDVPLGEGDRVRLVLPQDLSEKEAERICAVVRSIAFTDAELAAANKESVGRAVARQRAAGSLGALMAEWAAMEDAPDGC